MIIHLWGKKCNFKRPIKIAQTRWVIIENFLRTNTFITQILNYLFLTENLKMFSQYPNCYQIWVMMMMMDSCLCDPWQQTHPAQPLVWFPWSDNVNETFLCSLKCWIDFFVCLFACFVVIPSYSLWSWQLSPALCSRKSTSAPSVCKSWCVPVLCLRRSPHWSHT